MKTSTRAHEGRVTLVTGAAQGIGQAIAGALAERGAGDCNRPSTLPRHREAQCVGHDDAARAVRGRAQQNRATAGRGDNTTRRCDRVRTPRLSPSLEGHRGETAKGSWDVAQRAGSAKTNETLQDRASCGLAE